LNLANLGENPVTTRRDFLLSASSGIACFSLFGWNSVHAQKPKLRVRKSVAKLNANSPEIKALADAIQKMKALGGKDRRGWEAQAAIHGTLQGGFKSCQHQNWFFLPWHRAYLYFFEDIVRKLSETDDFALPYWDWTKDNKFPDLFFNGPFANPVRERQPSGRRPTPNGNNTFTKDELDRFVGQTVISRIMNTTDFETFGGSPVQQLGDTAAAGDLENTPHNFVHRWVGGDMATAGSPYDPIFWVHHCNIDRLWVEWMRKHKNALPNDKKWLNTVFKDDFGFVNRAGENSEIMVEKSLETANLGYEYDSSEIAVGATFAPSKPDVIGKLEMGKASLVDRQSLSFSERPSSLQATSFARALELVTTPRKPTIRMRVRDVHVPENENVSLDFHVNCEKASSDVKVSDATYVGSCTFFGHGKQGHGGKNDGTASFLLDATPTFGRLYADRPLKADEPIKITMIAKPLAFPDSSPWAGEAKQLSPSQVSFEVVIPA
jgi:tyrosinase